MIEQEWQGGRKDERLYRKVRSEKQKIVREKYERIKPYLGEREKRLWAANEAMAFGDGGIRAVSEAVGMSQKRVIQGRRELEGKLNKEQESATGTAAPERRWAQIDSGKATGRRGRHRRHC